MNANKTNTVKHNKKVLKDMEFISIMFDNHLQDLRDCIKNNKSQYLPLIILRMEHTLAAIKDNTSLKTPVKYPDGTLLLSLNDIQYE